MLRPPRFRAAALIGSILFALSVFFLNARAQTRSSATDGVDPAALRLVERMAENYRGYGSLSATITSTGQGIPGANSTLWLKILQPGSLNLRMKSGAGEKGAFSNGSSLFFYRIKNGKRVMEGKIPASHSLAATLKQVVKFGDFNLGPSASILTGSDPFLDTSNLLSLVHVKSSQEGDQEIQTLKARLMTASNRVVEMTYAIGSDDFLLRRVEIHNPEGGVRKEVHTSTVPNPSLPASLFMYTSPAKGKKGRKSNALSQLSRPVPVKDPYFRPTVTLKPAFGTRRRAPVPVEGENGEAVEGQEEQSAPETQEMLIEAQGGDAPVLKVLDLNGQVLDLRQYRGKVVLLDFWASWCPPCRREMPKVVNIYRKYHGQGFDIVGISLDTSRNNMTAYMGKVGMTWRQYYDGKGWDNDVATAYDVHSVPHTYLIGRDGRIVAEDLWSWELEGALKKALKKM